VDDGHRGKGYGREIMLLAEQECRQRGLTSLRLTVFGRIRGSAAVRIARL
jgi:GNAT superfamily N-acetyltransferase